MEQPSACQKSLAEFAARRRQRDSDHFLSGRTPEWSLLPLRGNSPPVPDRKYLSGCKSSAAALCRAQPPKAALGAELCDLYAKGVQIVRAADCNPFVKKEQSPFSTVSSGGISACAFGGIMVFYRRKFILKETDHGKLYEEGNPGFSGEASE